MPSFLLPGSRLSALTLLLAFACTATVTHALTWETTEKRFELNVGTAESVVEFPFKNETKSSISITGVKSGCDCSVAERPEHPIPPGGSGILKVRYHPGSSPGERVVPIEVTTDEPKAKPTVLQIKATMKPVLSFSPLLVRWKRDDPADTKQITIRNVGNEPIASLVLLPSPAGITAKLMAGDTEGSWTLEITPASTANPATAHVQLEAELKGHRLSFSVYALVR